jgi:hypothetical protein
MSWISLGGSKRTAESENESGSDKQMAAQCH